MDEIIKTNIDGEKNPTSVCVFDSQTANNSTFPSKCQGQVTGTSTGLANDNLAHVCDFSALARKNTALKRFLNAQANNIRDAIRAVMRALGYSDATGTFQWIKDSLRAIQRGLKYIQEEVIQPIIDFENIVIGYVAKLNGIIAYILNLPAKLLAFLQDCLTALYKSVAAIFDDVSGITNSNPFADIISEARTTAAVLSQTVASAVAAAGTAAAAASLVTSIPNLVSPLKKGP